MITLISFVTVAKMVFTSIYKANQIISCHYQLLRTWNLIAL